MIKKKWKGPFPIVGNIIEDMYKIDHILNSICMGEDFGEHKTDL